MAHCRRCAKADFREVECLSLRAVGSIALRLLSQPVRGSGRLHASVRPHADVPGSPGKASVLRGRCAQVSEIRYRCKMTGGVPVVTAPAEIDITTADQLRAVLLDAAARGHATVVVDLTRTRFCDSCGLHTLLRAHKLARADGGELRLVVPADGPVPRIFTLMCLDRLIPCFASLEEALAQAPAAANRRRDTRGPEADQTRTSA